MIGNDIVDLEIAKHNSRWEGQRFLDKLFSAEEQYFIKADDNRFQNIWRLWSMKESAYKIISRGDDIVRFIPKSFECCITNSTEGQVVFENTFVSTLTETHSKFIYTNAHLNTEWTYEVFQLQHSDAKSQHKETYQNAINFLANLTGVSQDTIEIRKDQFGVPHIYADGILQEELLSITHHGHFGALAIAI
ncbi:MAG: 4'-phosphopantetheinyl transferase superfamily protein [Aquaticitalea sp.]